MGTGMMILVYALAGFFVCLLFGAVSDFSEERVDEDDQEGL